MKNGRWSFETQLKIEFLPPKNDSKQCLEKSLIYPETKLIHNKPFLFAISVLLILETSVNKYN